MLELIDVRLGQKVRTRREDLPELDVSGTQLDEALAKCFGFGASISLGYLVAVETDAFDGQQPLPIGKIAQAIVGEKSDRGDQARKMLWRQDHA